MKKSNIRLTKKQKIDLAKILRRSGKITAIIALHMLRPKNMLDCIRYVRKFEKSKYFIRHMEVYA